MRLWWAQRTSIQQLGIITASIFMLAILIILCATLPLSSWDFRNNLWGPTHLLLTNRSPYRIDQLFDGSNSVWMPTTIGAFSPLGLLALGQATTLWGITSFATYVAIVIACMRTTKPAPIWLAVGLLLALLFPPFITHVGLGQFSVFAILLALLSAELLERRIRLWSVALCLVLLCTKPQLAPLVGIGALVALYQRGGVKLLVRLFAWGLLFTVLFITPLFVLYPNWIDGLLWAFGRNATWLHPSSLLFLSSRLGAIGVVLWGILLIAVVLLTGWLWRKQRPQNAVIWTLALTVLVTPYLWSYDFVLLIPLLIYTLFGVTGWLPRLILAIGYSAIWGYFVSLRLSSTNSDDVYWWVPIAIISLCLLCWWVSRVRHQEVVGT